MVFSRLRRHISSSSQEDLRSLGPTQGSITPESTGQRSPPPLQPGSRKLQRSAQSQHAPFYPHPGHADMYQTHQPMPLFPMNGPPPGYPPPQYYPPAMSPPPHPGYMSPPPQQYRPPPPQVRQEPLTEVLHQLKEWPAAPLPPPPPHAWTPNQPPLGLYLDSRIHRAVPMYELPPPDLIDYDMSYMIAIRTLPEWNKAKEDQHWEQVRRNRNAGIRCETEREDCVVM